MPARAGGGGGMRLSVIIRPLQYALPIWQSIPRPTLWMRASAPFLRTWMAVQIRPLGLADWFEIAQVPSMYQWPRKASRAELPLFLSICWATALWNTTTQALGRCACRSLLAIRGASSRARAHRRSAHPSVPPAHPAPPARAPEAPSPIAPTPLPMSSMAPSCPDTARFSVTGKEIAA